MSIVHEQVIKYINLILNKLRKVIICKRINNCGKNLKVYGKVRISNPELISIGKNVRLNHDVTLLARGRIIIGNNVTLSMNTKLITTGYEITNWVNRNHFEKKHISKDIFINNSCWIGANVIILPGIKIRGKGVVIGAGSVVTKNVYEDNVVLAGNPAKIIKHLE